MSERGKSQSCFYPSCDQKREVSFRLSFWNLGEHLEGDYCLEHAQEVTAMYLEWAKKGQRMVAKDVPRYVRGE